MLIFQKGKKEIDDHYLSLEEEKNHTIEHSSLIQEGLTILASHPKLDTDKNKKFLTKKIESYPFSVSKNLIKALKLLSDKFESRLFTQENFEFILNEEFSLCYPMILCSLSYLQEEKKLNHRTRSLLLKYPHHALVIARRNRGFPFLFTENPIDERVDEFWIRSSILGEISKDPFHTFYNFTPELLAEIVFMSMDQSYNNNDEIIDERTALITAIDAIKKPYLNSLKNRKRKYNKNLEKFYERGENCLTFSRIFFRASILIMGIGGQLYISFYLGKSIVLGTPNDKAIGIFFSVLLGLVNIAGTVYFLSKVIKIVEPCVLGGLSCSLNAFSPMP